MLKLSTGNTKTGPVLTLNFPAGPAGGCDPAAPCRALCYANKGRWTMFKNVRDRLIENVTQWTTDPAAFETQLYNQTAGRSGYFRYFSSGDIPGPDFFRLMLQLADDRPRIRFLVFTKKYSIVNSMIWAGAIIPDNLAVIFSLWPAWPCNNPYNLPVALVKLNGRPDDCRTGPDPFICPGNCRQCHQCWDMTAGDQVLFHQH